MNQKLVPLGKRIAVQRIEEETTIKGIIIPDAAKKKENIGKVFAVGPDTMGIMIDDIVVIDRFGSGHIVTVNDEEYIICKQEDILARIEDAQ